MQRHKFRSRTASPLSTAIQKLGIIVENIAPSITYVSCSQPKLPPSAARSERGAAWLAHHTGGVGVGGSNPLAPTNFTPRSNAASRSRWSEVPHGHRRRNFQALTDGWAGGAVGIGGHLEQSGFASASLIPLPSPHLSAAAASLESSASSDSASPWDC